MLFTYFQGKIKFSHCILLIWLFWIFIFILFYFLKWNHYFSARENLLNSSCHFWKHKSVFLQILHQYSVPSNITPLYFFSSNILYFGQKQLIKVQIFEIFECSGENLPNSSCHFPNHKSVFLQILHHSSVSWKITPLYFFSSNIIYFGQKQPIKVQIFEIFECSGENLPNSSCHFPNHKPVFLQILHDSSVSWKITPLYFFRSNVIYFAQKEPIKVQILESFEWSVQNSPNSSHFWDNKSVFLQILYHFSVSWDISSLYSFRWSFVFFQKKNPIKVQIWWNFTLAVKSLKLYTLMSSFYPNNIKFQLKK